MKFKVGDKVILKDGPDCDESNPIWGRVGNVWGTVVEKDESTPFTTYNGSIIFGGYEVEWQNGRKNSYDIDGLIWKLAPLKSEEKKIAKKLELSQLEKVVIAQEVKDEIVAVLKQHSNSKKLFVEWGLGEVIEYGKGMTFLFYGPPGTGKTWMATCIAKAFGTELLTIGAGEIQTQEPGGANRNIQNAFATAKEEGKVLFLDECDSLITNRSDVGMILGSEINTLLTEIERFEGVCILATNRIENLDEALERRISLIIEFPEPDFNQRKEIWKKLLPEKLPLAKEVSLDKLAEYKLTGGLIKNCVLQAARFAIADESKDVALKHFDMAISRVMKSKSLMGTSSRYRQVRVREDMGVSNNPQVKVEKRKGFFK